MKGDAGGEKSAIRDGAHAPDQSVPRWVCQKCRHALCVVGVDSYADKFFPDQASRSSASSSQGIILGSSGMDQSFVVLSKQNKPQNTGASPHKRSTAQIPEAAQPAKVMEESYVLLPPAAASVYKTEAAALGDAEPSHDSSPVSPLQANNFGFHGRVTVLKRAFEIASAQTQVHQPLCLECLRVLSDKLEQEVEDVSRDIKAYEECLRHLETESYDVLSEADFLKEKQKIEDEERKLQAAIEEAEKQYLEVTGEMTELEQKTKQFEELEEKYWHDVNNFHFQLTCHQEERDSILAKIEVSQAHLEHLKQTNVLNDAFYISHDGEFGTINNFRLGRISKILVEWDEVNAAWGQACLLLHTMAEHFRPKFVYRIKIQPIGSYPRISDGSNNSYDLFGPVNIFWSTRYDRAMTLYLTCLKDFADFAYSKDRENNTPPEKCLKLPYKIENDKVEGYTITQSFNKQENWTKALKYMLCDLKWVLHWFVANTNFHPISNPPSTSSTPTSSSRRDTPVAPARPPNAKHRPERLEKGEVSG